MKKEEITPESAKLEMDEIVKLNDVDPEAGHSKADDLLCRIAKKHGYGDIVKSFNKMDRWYA
ncbi:MAG: hypothetical protein AABY32_01055 [Nanoarchaeota archaeon]